MIPNPDRKWLVVCSYFFPEAFNNGYRLEHCADELMETFYNLRRKAGLTKSMEIPMQYFTLTIEYALKKFGANGENISWITKNCWEEAILKSGYVDEEIHQDVL